MEAVACQQEGAPSFLHTSHHNSSSHHRATHSSTGSPGRQVDRMSRSPAGLAPPVYGPLTSTLEQGIQNVSSLYRRLSYYVNLGDRQKRPRATNSWPGSARVELASSRVSRMNDHQQRSQSEQVAVRTVRVGGCLSRCGKGTEPVTSTRVAPFAGTWPGLFGAPAPAGGMPACTSPSSSRGTGGGEGGG